MTALIVQSGKQKGKKLVLPAKDVVVGREDDCQIRLSTKEISRHHCVLKQTTNGITVTDLGSQNGTLVNDERIEAETVLQGGDILQVGPMVFQVAGKKKPSASDSDSSMDDDIASWLNEDSTDDGTASSDTTIIRKRSDEPPVEEPTSDDQQEQPAYDEAVSDETPAEQKRVPPASKRKFNSIAEEGADIIRRHLEMIREND